MRYVLDTCSLRAASPHDLVVLAGHGELVVPPVAVYELLYQVLRSHGGAARATLGTLLDVEHTVGPEAIDLMRAVFDLRPLTGSRNSPGYAGVLMRWAADRGATGLVDIWRDLWRRGHVAHAPDNPDAWKGELGATFRTQLLDLARAERERAKQHASEIVRQRVAKGRVEPSRKVRRALEGYVHDTLLESFWPSVRLLHLTADAAGLEVVAPTTTRDPDGSQTLAELCHEYGYVGGLEFAMRAYTLLVDRYIWGHSGHRNDFADVMITMSVNNPTDLFVSEERWWRHYVGPAVVCSVREAIEAATSTR